MDCRYKLSAGTQVREEDFGLLFYTKAGPRLYFLPSKTLIEPAFFDGHETLGTYLSRTAVAGAFTDRVRSLKTALGDLCQKGVIIEF